MQQMTLTFRLPCYPHIMTGTGAPRHLLLLGQSARAMWRSPSSTRNDRPERRRVIGTPNLRSHRDLTHSNIFRVFDRYRILFKYLSFS